ncbi:MAG: hypothetical protein U1F65_12120 [Verrucomicrobiota bacterium]
MNSRTATILWAFGLLLLIVALVVGFPRVVAFVEMGAQELKYFWWMILVLVFAVWLIWGFGKTKK